MYYLGFFIFYIFVLGSAYKINGIIYFMVVLSILPMILVIYQVPYQTGFFNYNTIICFICQLTFFVSTLCCVYLNIS